jgi:hypothetical protein
VRQSIVFLFVVCLAALPIAQTRSAKTLDLYLIDVEGGGATLFVAPSGESVLAAPPRRETPAGSWTPSRTRG